MIFVLICLAFIRIFFHKLNFIKISCVNFFCFNLIFVRQDYKRVLHCFADLVSSHCGWLRLLRRRISWCHLQSSSNQLWSDQIQQRRGLSFKIYNFQLGILPYQNTDPSQNFFALSSSVHCHTHEITDHTCSESLSSWLEVSSVFTVPSVNLLTSPFFPSNPCPPHPP